MVEIITNLSFKEYLKYNYIVFLKSRFVIGFITVASFIIIVLTIAYSKGDLNLAGVKIDYTTFAIFLGVITFTPLSVYWQSKTNYNSAQGLKDPITYTFTERGVYSRGKNFESISAWNVYHKVIETKKHFILHQTNLIVNLIPKSAFKSREQIEEVRKLITLQPALKYKLRRD